MSEYADRLAAHDQAFQEAKRMRDFGELPDDGDYQGIVERFDFFEARSTGELYLKTEVKLTGPSEEVAGWGVEMIHNLDDSDKFDFLKTHLHRLGCTAVDEPGFKLSELESVHLPKLLDVPVEVNVYTYDRKDGGGTGRGARINKALGEPMRNPETPAPAAPAVPQATNDETIPF